MNVAVKYHLDNAVTGVYPNYAIDYAKVLLSKGGKGNEKIDDADALTVTPAAGTKVAISWDANAFPSKHSKDTDLLTALFYSPAKDRFIEAARIGTRSSLNVELDLPNVFAADTLHCWLLFISADETLVSRSSYMGTVLMMK